MLVKKDLDCSIEGKDVLIVEDIIDTGYTLRALRQDLLARKPKSLKIGILDINFFVEKPNITKSVSS